tara:strand:+ start:25179 stop:26432 length:1254 start_codon:yes stop_codon:yes gene_type:complete
MKKWVVTGLFTAISFTQTVAHADWQWSGFATAAGAASNVKFLNPNVEPLYVEKIGKQITLENDSVLGFQVDKMMDDDFSITGRIVAEGRNDWRVKATRAYFEYHAADNWFWRAGRMPIDYLIYSAKVNETHAYSWIALPESVYHVIPFHYEDAISTGAKFEFFDRVLNISGAYGSLTEETETPVTNIELKYKLRQVASLMASFGDEIFKVHASYHVGRLTWAPNAQNVMVNNFINNTLVPQGFMGLDQQNYLTVDNARMSYSSIGYTFDWKRMISGAEFLRRKSSSAIIPDINAWYVMLGCRYHELIPYVTFARQRIMDNDTRRFSGLANTAAMAANGLGNTLDRTVQNIAEGIDGPAAGDQTSITVGVRWNITKLISIKGSYQHIHPDRYGSGLFNVHPHRSVNIWRAGIDGEFFA